MLSGYTQRSVVCRESLFMGVGKGGLGGARKAKRSIFDAQLV